MDDACNAGVGLRDWLAQHATEDDLAVYLRGAGEGDYAISGERETARYAYADAMLAARVARPLARTVSRHATVGEHDEQQDNGNRTATHLVAG